MFSDSGTRREKNFLHLEKNGLNIKFTLLIQAISSKKSTNYVMSFANFLAKLRDILKMESMKVFL